MSDKNLLSNRRAGRSSKRARWIHPLGDPSQDNMTPLAGLADELLTIAKNRSEPLSLATIIEGFHCHGSLGAVLFVLTLPVLIPLPPGGSMILSLPLLLVSPQLLIGKGRLWLPKWLLQQRIQQDVFAALAHRLHPLLSKIGHVGRPRIKCLTSPIAARLIGLVATAIAIVEVLPIPFSTYLPASALILLSLGLISRDGVLVLAGYFMTGVSVLGICIGVEVTTTIFHWLAVHLHLFF